MKQSLTPQAKQQLLKVGLPILIALLSLVGITLAVTDDNGDGSPDRVTITVPVDTLDRSPDKDKVLTVPEAAVEAAEQDIHAESKDETPETVPPAVLAENAEALQENRETTEALPTAGASGGVPGCRTQFVQNQSSRRGVRPTVQVLHYTVSPNRPGWSDVDGITAFFNRSSSQASSHFVIDAEGNCAYIVPIEAKSWTQAGGNPWAVSYEIIATGRESVYLPKAGLDRLRSVMRWVSARTGIPMRTGKISGCSPSLSGTVQHAQGGSCWGGHIDIGPFPFASIAASLHQGGSTTSSTPDLKALTPGERKQASLLLAKRRVAARNGGWSKVSPMHLEQARSTKRWLEHRNVELHRLGLSTSGRKVRHSVIHAVL